MMENRQSHDLSCPVTLDVVEFNGNEYQVIGSSRTGTPKDDMFLLKDIRTGVIVRVRGGIFNPLKISRDPGPGDVYRRDEDVRVTGSIAGGKIEE